MRNTFISDLLELAKIDERVILITGDLGFGVVDEFAKQLPRQFLNFGINEQTMMGAAAGMAKAGLKPFVYSIGNFPTLRCLEQIRNDVCYMNLDVTIVAIGAGFAYGSAGYSHHLVDDIGAMSAMPNMKVFSPADSRETKLAFRIIKDSPGPKYLRLGKGGETDLTTHFMQDNPGFSALSGDPNFAIFSTGNILSEAIKLREMFTQEPPTLISFYDFGLVGQQVHANKFSKIVTLEEHRIRGGFGSLVFESSSTSNCRIQTFGIAEIDSAISGSQSYLREKYELSAERVFDKIH